MASTEPPRIPGRQLSEMEASQARAFIGNLLEINGPGATAFPGAQPVSLGASHLERLLTEDFFVSEKADGIRVLLYASVDRQTKAPYTLLFDRRNDYYRLDGFGIPSAADPRIWVSDTLIDGELVNDTVASPNGPKLELQFLAFDTLLCEGEKTFQKSYHKRIGRLRSLIISYMKRVDKDPHYARIQPFRLRQKKIHASYQLDDVFKEMLTLKHGSDGLIFTHKDIAYKFGTCQTMIKWKPADENTVDFLLRQTFDKGVPTFYINLFHGNEGYKYHSEFELGEDASKIAPGELLDHRIIECKYDKNWPHFWRFSRFRDDKDAANHITTYVKVMESIEDNVTRKKLLDVSGDMRTNWKEREAAAKAAAISGPVPEAPPTKIAPPVSVRNVKFGVVNRAKKGSGKPDTVAQMFSDGAGPPSTTGKPSPALKTEVTTKPSDKRKNDVDIQKLLSTQLDDEDVPLTSPTKRRIVESDEDDDYADASTETKKQKL